MKTYKYRLYPTNKQSTTLKQTLEVCKNLYNSTLEYRKNSWEKDKVSISLYSSQNKLTKDKEENVLLNSVHSQVLQNVNVRVDLAFQAFFRRIKSGENPGYPRFKSSDRYDSFTFPQGGFKINGDKLYLSKIGNVDIKYHRPIEGDIKTLTVIKSATGKWYACFSVETEKHLLEPSGNQIGIDVGLKSFAALSTNEEIPIQKFFRKEQKALAKAQRRLEKEAVKVRRVVARINERIKFKRNNFAHQESRKIVNTNGIICIEDIQINNMVKNHKLSKSILDAGWSQFFNYILYKAEDAGRTIVKVNPAYTSQTCSRCKERQSTKLTLSDRMLNCEYCGLKIDRDHNAALNILALGLQSLGMAVEAVCFS